MRWLWPLQDRAVADEGLSLKLGEPGEGATLQGGGAGAGAGARLDLANKAACTANRNLHREPSTGMEACSQLLTACSLAKPFE